MDEYRDPSAPSRCHLAVTIFIHVSEALSCPNVLVDLLRSYLNRGDLLHDLREAACQLSLALSTRDVAARSVKTVAHEGSSLDRVGLAAWRFDQPGGALVGCVTVGDGRVVGGGACGRLELFTAALGLGEPWRVSQADFAEESGRLDLHVVYQRGARFACPQPGCRQDRCPVHDTLATRPCGEASDKNTPAWAFSIRPAVPVYWRWTPGRVGTLT
jgi:hypothetical protein